MNPSAILKLMSAKAAFTKNHPKFSAFCKAALSRPIEPGTIIEISLQRPGEEPMMAASILKRRHTSPIRLPGGHGAPAERISQRSLMKFVATRSAKNSVL